MDFVISALLVLVGVSFGIYYFFIRNKRSAPPLPLEEVTPQSTVQVRDQVTPQVRDQEVKSRELPAQEAKHQEARSQQETNESGKTSLQQALNKTREHFWGRIKNAFTSDGANADLEAIEEVLYTSDLGPSTVERLFSSLQEVLSRSEQADANLVRGTLKQHMLDILLENQTQNTELKTQGELGGPIVWLVVGVNGAGKTTTIGKLAAHLAGQGKKVLVAAGDTFRAAAGGQLKIWTERAQVDIFNPPNVSDPSAVAFDAVTSAKAKGMDVVIIDTAGRLHTQKNLMEEIKKMRRVIQKVIPTAPHEVLLVLDASSGQNALIQAKEFHQALELTGVILTKLDGTAKGGVAVGIASEIKVPIKLVGVGEKIGDWKAFNSQDFVDGIFEN